MKKSVEIIGLPVMSINEAKELGTVKELLINPVEGTIAAVALDDGQWYHGAKLIPFTALIGIGENAVTIKHSNVVLPIAEAPELEALLIADVKVIGSKVLTNTGRTQGKVTEICIDTTGTIINCEVTEATGNKLSIPKERIYTFGKEVLMIAEADSSTTPAVAITTPEIASSIEMPEKAVPAIQAEIISAPAAKQEITAQPEDDSAKKFDDKHRKYLLGKKSTRRIETDNGVLIVDNGGEITEEVLQKANLAGKFVELSMSI